MVVEHEEELGRLDAIAGDGDHGIGMRRGVDAAVAAAEQAAANDGGASAARILTAAGEAWSERAGGTSGALWGSAIIAAGQALGNRDSYSGEDAAAAVTAFTDAITALGKAEPGDKTMVDALVPFRDAFLTAFDGGATVTGSLAAAAAAATDGRRPDRRVASAQGPGPSARRKEPRPPGPRCGVLRTHRHPDFCTHRELTHRLHAQYPAR